MAKKPVRLHFKEDELADQKVAKAAGKAGKAADKAEKADEKLPVKHKLRRESSASANAKKKLRFGKLEIETVEAPKPVRSRRAAAQAPLQTVSGTAHKEISRYEDDNTGVQAAHQTEEAAEGAAHATEDALYSHKLKKYEKAEKLIRKSDNANVEAIWQKHLAEDPEAASNPLSRWMQKREIKKEYAAARAAGRSIGSAAEYGSAAKGTAKAAKESKDVVTVIGETISEHSKGLLVILICAGMLVAVVGSSFSFPLLLQGSINGVLGTTYTAEDKDILDVEAAYTAMETDLRNQINNIESDYPGYDEYVYNEDEIGHNPYELASYLTVLFEDYTLAEVQAELTRLFNAQYDLGIEETVETRTRVETVTTTRIVLSIDTETGELLQEEEEYEYEIEVEYEYYILNVTLVNHGLASVTAAGMDEEEASRYSVLMTTYGNKQYLFEDSIYSIYSVSSEYADYAVSTEALSDERFANMIEEAEKYLGYAYVWGGSSPSTGFDCSGYVSWVINNCNNGWSVGRQTANGLLNLCTVVSASEAQSGDLVFFEGTYDTSGASHVGIYVGDGMMIHCGNPIQYTSIETSYWQEHLLCFSRLP
ncbi:MAG: C40 family peptidase [Lachnospiraceae bacterium]|nr:C40 family peptidase [Lachnospiraceae bacterium]